MRNFPILAVLLAPCLLLAQEQNTEPFGFNTTVCPAGSDTIVGVPFRANGSRGATLSALPAVNGDEATLSITGTPAFTANAYAGGWYAKFTTGSNSGRYYTITANTTDTLTIDLNGDSVAAVTATDKLLIAQYWTLDSLFPPAGATTAFDASNEPNGHAIVASTATSLALRRTRVMLPDIVRDGTNLAPSRLYYIYRNNTTGVSQWNAEGTYAGAPPTPGQTVLPPDNYFIIRHPSTVKATRFRSVGEVEIGSQAIPLATLTTGSQDNFIAITRPVAVKLSALNLANTSAFVTSSSTSLTLRRDTLLVFDNSLAAQNKAPSKIYYFSGGNWLDATNSNAIANDATIPAGNGFMIRKYKTATGATVFWNNTAPY